MLLFIDGFDHYAATDLAKKYTTYTGGGAINASGGRRGGGCVYFQMYPYYVTKVLATPLNTLIVGVAMKFDSITNKSHALGFRSPTQISQLGIMPNPNGVIS